MKHVAQDYSHVPVVQIEDLSNAVLGAGLEATQLTNSPVNGSLVFIERDGVTISSGSLNGPVALQGALSDDKVTLGLGLQIAPGSRHWITQEVETGSVGVFRPGDNHDALYRDTSLYITMTLPPDRLEEQAADLGFVLDAANLPGTGFDARLLDPSSVRRIHDLLGPFHAGSTVDRFRLTSLQFELTSALVGHLARDPRPVIGIPCGRGHSAIVARARDYIDANLSEPLCADDIAVAAKTSRSALYRAFDAILGQAPNTYVHKLRLNRIRNELASEEECAVTIAVVANRWGISELGRMSQRYRHHFGELPSETLARTRSRLRHLS